MYRAAQADEGGKIVIASDQDLKSLFADIHTIAAVGLNNRPGEHNYEVASYEQSQGYKIIPVNPDIPQALGQPAVPSLSAIKDSVDLIHLMPHHISLQHVDAAELQGCKAIWCEPGVDMTGIATKAKHAGIPLHTGRSFRTEHQRLMMGLQDFH